MGKNKDAAVGFIIIGVIIAVIAGVVSLVLSPGETKTESEPGATKETVRETVNDRIISPEEEQEIEKVANKIAESIPEYQKTNEILKMYSTEEILDDILDNTATELDRRIEYHSVTEPKDGTNREDLLYIVGEIEYEVTACEQNKHPTGINDLLENLRFDLEYAIKSGYAKDPSITPILQRAKEAISDYSHCPYRSEIQNSQATSSNNGFDPALVKAAKENIPEIQKVAKVTLNACKKVDSYSDYRTFAEIMSSMSDNVIKFTAGADAVLSELEDRGYDRHPEVGPLIEETRDLYFEAYLCITELQDKYEN